MGDDLGQRLTAAAADLRQHDLVTRRCAELRDRAGALTRQIAALRADLADEQEDVDRLEHVSLTRIIASLRGARDDDLERERAEADAARYRVAEAEARLETLRREYDAEQAQQARLRTAPDRYAKLLDEHEQRLRGSADPRGGRLIELARDRGWFNADLREIEEAQQAAGTAQTALSEVSAKLRSASNWSTFDILGGRGIASAIKQSQLDGAARAAAHADRCLALLRTELADLGGASAMLPSVVVDGLTQFLDVWLDNIFTDFQVHERIEKAKRNVARSQEMVWEVLRRLEQRTAVTRDRLASIESERRALVAGAVGAVGAVDLTAALAAYTSSDTDSSSSSGSGAGSPSLSTSDVPVGGGVVLASPNVVVTQPTGGQYKAFNAVCTHQGCLVAKVENGSIVCTCHNSMFSISDGSVQSGPATSALAARTVTVNGTSLSIS